MPEIKTVYVVNHSHTDIGYTDHQDLCYRQHGEFIDQALDLCDATADFPAEARYRWTCEVTAVTERYLDRASERDRERFRAAQQQGLLDVAGMQYNLTPLLTTEQMIRTLYPVRRLRDTYGIDVRSAMQCDVNGVSWLFADLLPAIGVDFLTMSVNPVRGGVPKPMPGAFWWEGRGGSKLLTWNGYHYLFGRSIAKLGDWRFVERDLQDQIAKLEHDPDYPFDFMYCQSTHPIRVDNGPPDPRMPDFVRDWNASGHSPRIEFTTPTAFGDLLRDRYGDALPTWRGDWLDWWSDGVASSAYETGVNRATHKLMQEAELLGAWSHAAGRDLWSTARADALFESATLYDEHTWGSFASIDAPRSLWTKGQWNRKSSFAYSASSEAHDMVARGALQLSTQLGEPGPEGRFNLGDLKPDEAYSSVLADDVLVINTLPWDRLIQIEEPELRAGAAPVGVLDCFFPRDVPWGGDRPTLPLRKAIGIVPGSGYAFLPARTTIEADDLVADMDMIANAHYRIRVDPETGGLLEWTDLTDGHDYAGTYGGYRIGQYVYEWLDDPRQRLGLFHPDFSAPDFGEWFIDPPFVREPAAGVVIREPVIGDGEVSIAVDVIANGIYKGRCVYRLLTRDKSLHIDWLLDKEPTTDVESVFVAFPFALGEPRFRADINGLPLTPDMDQLPGSVRNWYPVGHWVDVSDGERGVTIAPLEAPLVQLGGITTGRSAEQLELGGAATPTVMSWALNNQWFVNFQASQGGEIPLRYRLNTHEGSCDDLAAHRFGLEQATPPIALRDVKATGLRTGQFIQIDGSAELIHVKTAENGDGVILRLQNSSPIEATARLRVPLFTLATAALTSPDERDIAQNPIIDGEITVTLPPGAIQSVRITFAS